MIDVDRSILTRIHIYLKLRREAVKKRESGVFEYFPISPGNSDFARLVTVAIVVVASSSPPPFSLESMQAALFRSINAVGRPRAAQITRDSLAERSPSR